jgi:hypothetical protein
MVELAGPEVLAIDGEQHVSGTDSHALGRGALDRAHHDDSAVLLRDLQADTRVLPGGADPHRLVFGGVQEMRVRIQAGDNAVNGRAIEVAGREALDVLAADALGDFFEQRRGRGWRRHRRIRNAVTRGTPNQHEPRPERGSRRNGNDRTNSPGHDAPDG